MWHPLYISGSASAARDWGSASTASVGTKDGGDVELFGSRYVLGSEGSSGRVGKEGVMTLRFQEVAIENVNGYPEGIVGGLQAALRAGVEVAPDPKRPNFYVVYSEGHRYYIDVLSGGDRVILLGAWHSRN